MRALSRAFVDVLRDAEWRRRLEADTEVVRAALSWDAAAAATVRVYERVARAPISAAKRKGA